MFEYMNKDTANVVIVHCNAGKGRTGTAISCSLLYSGLSTNFIDALTYYGHQRFSTGRGTTQPAQQRYVQYFDEVLKRKVVSPSIKLLKFILIQKIPTATGNIVEPCVEILDGKNFEMVWTDNPKYKKKKQFGTYCIHDIAQYNANKDEFMVI